jgi:hypothetical protein
VRGERDVLGFSTVTVNDSGDLSGGAETTSESLTERGAGSRLEGVLFSHDFNLSRGLGPLCVLLERRKREERQVPDHRVDYGDSIPLAEVPFQHTR